MPHARLFCPNHGDSDAPYLYWTTARFTDRNGGDPPIPDSPSCISTAYPTKPSSLGVGDDYHMICLVSRVRHFNPSCMAP
jgi:hypothetical protein